jgi:hypothetical protein
VAAVAEDGATFERFVRALLLRRVLPYGGEEATRGLWYISTSDWRAVFAAPPAQLRDAALEAVEGGEGQI